jgi:hypothetical protein
MTAFEMERWELSARELCRDTISRYTHLGDSLHLQGSNRREPRRRARRTQRGDSGESRGDTEGRTETDRPPQHHKHLVPVANPR